MNAYTQAWDRLEDLHGLVKNRSQFLSTSQHQKISDIADSALRGQPLDSLDIQDITYLHDELSHLFV